MTSLESFLGQLFKVQLAEKKSFVIIIKSFVSFFWSLLLNRFNLSVRFGSAT